MTLAASSTLSVRNTVGPPTTFKTLFSALPDAYRTTPVLPPGMLPFGPGSAVVDVSMDTDIDTFKLVCALLSHPRAVRSGGNYF